MYSKKEPPKFEMASYILVDLNDLVLTEEQKQLPADDFLKGLTGQEVHGAGNHLGYIQKAELAENNCIKLHITHSKGEN